MSKQANVNDRINQFEHFVTRLLRISHKEKDSEQGCTGRRRPLGLHCISTELGIWGLRLVLHCNPKMLLPARAYNSHYKNNLALC